MAEKFDGHAGNGGKKKRRQYGIRTEKKSQCDACQRSVGKRVADHGVPAENEKQTDTGTENGDTKGNKEGVLHEIISQHDTPPL